MSDEVKFIFKTLLKVPILITIAYLVLNVVMFSLFYFRVLGYSYVVMETVAENNYIPQKDLDVLSEALDKLESPDADSAGAISNLGIFVDTSGTRQFPKGNVNYTVGSNRLVTSSVNNRVQYGRKITTGIVYTYNYILPLVKNGNALQYTGTTGTLNKVPFEYKVPGLKYYPDLD